jgi:SOS-response transcriptional repressor LexA
MAPTAITRARRYPETPRRRSRQIVLRADSSFDYEPIHLHPDDDFSISGKVVAVVKKVKG